MPQPTDPLPGGVNTKRIRIFALAKQLGVESRVLITGAKELGFHKSPNQLLSLSQDQVEQLAEWARESVEN
jgi:hypothetical protein